MTARNVPEPTSESGPFWDATRRRELVLQWCTGCGRGVHYPRVICPYCGSTELGWREMSGSATVYAHATHYGSDGPYSIALVDLAEGVRMLTKVVDVEPDHVAVGQAVELCWEPLEDGRALPIFRPSPPIALDRETTGT